MLRREGYRLLRFLGSALSSSTTLVVAVFFNVLFLFLLLGVFNSSGVEAGGATVFLLGELLLVSFLIAAFSYWMLRVWMRRRRGELGFRLQTRVVFAFASVGVLPAALVSGFSYLFFDYGVRAWFHSSIGPVFARCVSTALDCKSECVSAVVSSDVDNLLLFMGTDYEGYSREGMLRGAQLFNFSEVLLINKDGSVSLSSTSDSVFPVESLLNRQFPGNKSDLTTFTEGNLIGAVKLLDPTTMMYVVVLRIMGKSFAHQHKFFDSKIRGYREDLGLQLSFLQMQFSIVFLFLFLVILFVTLWLGVGFGKGIVGRLSALLVATKRVQDGDFDFKIENKGNEKEEELATIVGAFNQMVEKLSNQRLQLEGAYKEIDTRKRFVESVLSGVSSGVIALSSSRYVTLMNDRAIEILSCNQLDVPIEEVFPEVVGLLSGASNEDLTIVRGDKSLILSVSIELLKTEGLIITFDDISGLVEAQKQAAWSDVARKVAHEIKNPITPIYLAAERLSSKYADQIVSGKEIFLRYTDTIAKHVNNISAIVDEFVQFARMPKPVFEMCNISEIIREMSFLGQFGKNVVYYDLNLPDEEVLVLSDREQIAQVFVNIFKNACESIDASSNGDNGRIEVVVCKSEEGAVVEVRDNGRGFSEDLIGRLTDPYVTTRGEGTGLGLTIVSKILEEHGASMSFKNFEKGGGIVLITFCR